MFMAKGYLGIELTSAKIRYVFLTKKGKNIRLEKAGSFIFRVDPSAEGALNHMITNILKRENLSPQKIFVSLSRSDVLAREIPLPRMKNDEFEEVISSEIEKIPTYSENSFDYISQKFEIDKDKFNVVFAAINKQLLTYILSEVQKTKISFLNFEITPLNLPQILTSGFPIKPNQGILVINDMLSHLIIYQDKTYKLFYKTTSGSNHLISNNVVNEKNVSVFAGEVQRVLKAYHNDHKEEKIEDLLLIWDQSVSSELGEAIQKEVDQKIVAVDLKDYMDLPEAPPETETSEKKQSESLDNSVYLLPSCGILSEWKKIRNYFPLDHFFRDFHLKRCIFQASVLSLIFIAISGFFIGKLVYGLHQKKVRARKAIEQVQWEKEDLKNATRELYRKRDEYLRVRQGLLDQATYLRVINRVYWSDILGVVAEEMPEKLSLVSFQFRESGKVTFKGESMNIESVSELIRRIDKTKLLTNGRFDYLTEKIVDEKKIFTFGILAQLKEVPLEDLDKDNKDTETEEQP
jgi:hypothetical protein